MFLLRCNVENFGTLKDFEIRFENGLSVIKEDNGFGKSTTAAFVKAMFYGFNKYQGKEYVKNERARYKPWQGGRFGGSLDFSVGDKVYRIERFFGEKEKDDTFDLFDLNTDTISHDFSQNIGIELFGVDAESFEKSVFLPQQRLDSGMNASINAKLTGLVENSDDIGNFDSAMSELKKQNSARGVKGRLEKAQSDVLNLERQVSDRKSASDSLEILKVKYAETGAEVSKVAEELEILRKRITAASNFAAAKKDLDRRKELIEEKSTAEEYIGSLSVKYKNGMPGEADIEKVGKAVLEQDAAKNRLQLIGGCENEQESFKDLSDFFKNGLPDALEIANCRTQTVKLGVLKENFAAIKDESEEPKNAIKSGEKGAQKMVLAIALVLFLTGIGLLFVKSVIGIALIAVGIIAMGVSGFLMLRGMIFANSSQSNQQAELKKQKEQLELEISLCEREVNAFLSRYGTDVEIVAEKFDQYKRLKLFLEENLPKIAAEKEKMQGNKSVLEAFFMHYLGQIPEDATAVLNAIREDVLKFKSANDTVKICTERLSAIPEVAVDRSDETMSVDELIAKEGQMSARLDILKEQLVTTERQKNAAEKAADDVQELSLELEQKKGDVLELARSLEIVKLTEQMLSEARDGLSTRYMTVLKESFKKYADKICDVDVGEFLLDNELNLNLRREGKGRNRECFSEGYRDMLDICTRLALIDALYDAEKPMLILDDPFVNLDDKKTRNALSMLGELAKERQIVYLTCHSSRIPE